MTDPKPRRRLVPRFRIMPLTMTMLALMLVLKAQNIFMDGRALRQTLDGSAYAEDAPKEETASEEADKKEAAPEAATKEVDKKEAAPETEDDAAAKEDSVEEEDLGEVRGGALSKNSQNEKTLGQGKTSIKKIEKIKAKQNEDQFSKTEVDILTNLSKRREALEVREKELEIKETALMASENRINDKIIEMKNLKEEVDKVLALYNEKQETEIRGLVKIYEAMKPLDAAAIFNEMEMPILLEVIDKMSERKVAPVLAGMSPKRARDVTQELAEMRKVRADLKNQAAGL
jgi:flagellar motility protein MotE (MotC chaperone)